MERAQKHFQAVLEMEAPEELRDLAMKQLFCQYALASYSPRRSWNLHISWIRSMISDRIMIQQHPAVRHQVFTLTILISVRCKRSEDQWQKGDVPGRNQNRRHLRPRKHIDTLNLKA